MNTLVFVLIVLLTLLLLGYGVYEYIVHQNNLKQIPIRIHVNGTRGKSSVTRLIGAGLRAGGYTTITKVTGTFPRMILNDGTEVAVHRKQGANILEQLNIVDFCRKEKADVLLIECMALQPLYQRITEHQMIKATHGVITNIRLDHLDVMGPKLENVGDALALTIPANSKLFTGEDRMIDFLREKAEELKTKVYAADPTTISKNDMEGFTYIEHAENVALALDICASLDLDRETCLAAMKLTAPDEGALTKHSINHMGINLHYYNALAANDPESSIILWNSIENLEGKDRPKIIVLNARKDRIERSETLMQAASTLDFTHLFITGENVDLVAAMGKKYDIPSTKITQIAQEEPEARFAEIFPTLKDESVLIAWGNMGAGGSEFSKYFENYSQTKKS